MLKRIALCIVALQCIHGIAVAQQVTLKKSFWSGYKYSVGGGEYRKVGNSGKDLRSVMQSNPAAASRMDSYKKFKTAGLVTGIPGGVLVGWVIGGSIAGGWDENQDTYTTMLIIGVPLIVASAILDGKANSNLKKAVTSYNEGQANPPTRPASSVDEARGHSRVGLAFQFGI